MPNKPRITCKHAGCQHLAIDNGLCEKHHQTDKKYKSSANPFHSMYGRRWQKESKAFLSEHPWCTECMKHGRYTPATITDHIIPHKGNLTLFWDKSNWQGLCKHDHDVKTAKEDGGCGNHRKG